MENKLQELISTLKKQGMESGEEASRQIIEEANQKAKEILSTARSEAETIVSRAKNEAARSNQQIHSSMEIAASQLLTALKREIEENLLVLPLKRKLSEELNDTPFLRELLMNCVREYVNHPDRKDLTLIVSSEQKEKLADFSVELIKGIPGSKIEGKELTLELRSDGIKCGFIVGTTDGVVQLDFTDEAFLELFLRYLSPRFHGLFKPVDTKGLVNR